MLSLVSRSPRLQSGCCWSRKVYLSLPRQPENQLSHPHQLLLILNRDAEMYLKVQTFTPLKKFTSCCQLPFVSKTSKVIGGSFRLTKSSNACTPKIIGHCFRGIVVSKTSKVVSRSFRLTKTSDASSPKIVGHCFRSVVESS